MNDFEEKLQRMVEQCEQDEFSPDKLVSSLRECQRKLRNFVNAADAMAEKLQPKIPRPEIQARGGSVFINGFRVACPDPGNSQAARDTARLFRCALGLGENE